MARKKLKRNVTGLRNQANKSNQSPERVPDHNEHQPLPEVDEENIYDEPGWEADELFEDSNKIKWDAEFVDEEGDEQDEDVILADIHAGLFNVHKLSKNKSLCAALLRQAIASGDDPRDEDWLPKRVRKRLQQKKTPNRPKEYKKGPDVGSKSRSTRYRYADLLHDQSSLDAMLARGRAEAEGGDSESSSGSDDQDSPPSPTLRNMRIESITPPPLGFCDESPDTALSDGAHNVDVPRAPSPHIRMESTTPEPLHFDDDAPQRVLGKRKSAPPDSSSDHSDLDGDAAEGTEDEADGYEDDLDERLVGLTEKADIRDWATLRDQIKKDLEQKHRSNSLPLSKINQLMLIRNFATLRLRGLGRIAASQEIARQWHEKLDGSSVHFARRVRAIARHYQIFEQLPDEGRGGYREGSSLLRNEEVLAAARSWLFAQKKGKVTPLRFRQALNEIILPSVGVTVGKKLCERTARRWLVRLGWRRTLIKKGVYVDGHERDDVVQYRQHVFLPKMKEYSRRLVTYEEVNGDLVRVEPPADSLSPGERPLEILFHDESSANAFEVQTSIWLHKSQQVIPKKDKGRNIHTSAFIEYTNGQLCVRDPVTGAIVKNSRTMIFPGSNGDAWWDCAQLIEQVKTKAIPIFEEAHPGHQALFIFDQSSAHASLAPDALRAFEMNKSNGGKQRIQKDTIIPDTNPFPEFRGRPQKMTTENGEAKGLEQTLRERGFDVSKISKAKCKPVCPFESQNCCMARVLSQQADFANQISMLEEVITAAGHLCLFLPKFHCELNPIEMYWGWTKYRFRQADKPSWQAAKDAMIAALDACPQDVIRRFINRSFRWMEAYRIGLTGKAAQWAVRKQKGHRTVSRAAMMHLDHITNAV